MQRSRSITVAVFAALSLLAAACGGTDEGEPSADGSDATVEATDAAEVADASEGDRTGVTDNMITVGVLIWNLEAESTDAEAHWQVYFDDLNDRGGIAGRQVEPVYVEFDNAAVPITEACVSLTEDHDIFAVLASTSIWGPGVLCVTERHETPLLTAAVAGSGLEQELFDRSEGRLFGLGLTYEQATATLVEVLDERGELDGKRLGIVGLEGDDRDLGPLLDQLGHPHESYLTPLSTDSIALVPAAVDAQEADGIDGIILTPSFLVARFWMNEYAARDFRPRFYVTGEGALEYYPAEFDPGVFDGALGLADTYTGWMHEEDPIEATRAAACRETFESATDTTLEPGSDTYGGVMQRCDLAAIFEAGAAAAGEDLTRESFTEGIQGLGEIELASQPSSSFAPGKFTAADQVRLLEWQAECGCYVPITGFQAVDGS